MKNEHAATVVTADNAVKDAISTVTGSSFVSMLTSKVPEIANVMKAVVDTSAIDHKAITISEAIKAGSIKLPGAESIAAVTSGAPTPAMPEASVSVKQMIEPAPGKPECVNYTKAELDGFQTTVDNAMAASAAYNAEFAQWSKTNIEDWKISVDYNAKKKAAGATADNLHGTSTDPAVMAAWDQVYFQPGGYVGRRDEFNLTRLPESRRLAALANAMKAEKTKRYMFGKFPYTFAESLGKIYPEAEQTTLLDSTK
jgi:hypothetical protein